MQIGVVGLGRMGGDIARRLMQGGHACVVYDIDPLKVRALEAGGAAGAGNLGALVRKLDKPRVIWVMLPAGAPTEATIAALTPLLESGDLIIDGGNSFYKDDIRRARTLEAHGIGYVDVGTSGGVRGLERGYCLMLGGAKDAIALIDPILASLAPGAGDIARTKRPDSADPRAELGYIHAGSHGAGHFVKMIHNGIEYGLMQAYAEGFDILKNRNAAHLPGPERYDLNLADIAEVWRRGSVISSWLLDLTAQALANDPALEKFTGDVADSGEGRWTIEAAIEEAVPADVLTTALFARFRSRQRHTFADQLLSALRWAFGGHVEEGSRG
ncbi:MAG: phosphogluconate dehydrogenase (NAD(+)-dependent, decarboxylating) [Hyphomonadaceae bacterium]